MRSSLGKIGMSHFSFLVKTLRYRVRVPDRLLPKHLDIGCVTFFGSIQNARVRTPSFFFFLTTAEKKSFDSASPRALTGIPAATMGKRGRPRACVRGLAARGSDVERGLYRHDLGK